MAKFLENNYNRLSSPTAPDTGRSLSETVVKTMPPSTQAASAVIPFLPDEIPDYIFNIVLTFSLQWVVTPTSFELNAGLAALHAEVERKKQRRHDTVSFASVCKKWRILVWPKIFKFVALPYSSTEQMVGALQWLWCIDVGVRNTEFVRDLYISPGSARRLDYFVTLLLCWSCYRVEELTISM